VKRYLIPIRPMPKPRMTKKSSVYSKAAKRYWAWKDELWYACFDNALDVTTVAPPCISCEFTLPMPKSWSKWKREEMLGKIHRQKPDLSNLIKAIEDCLWDKDEGIGMYGRMVKRWGKEGQIEIILEEVVE